MMHNFNLKRTHYKQDNNEKVLPLLGEIGSLHFMVNAVLLAVSQLMLTISIVNQSADQIKTHERCRARGNADQTSNINSNFQN